MNRLPRDNPTHDTLMQDDAFDARARACYLQAAAAVPPQVRFKLRPQPTPARAPAPRPRSWMLGTAFAGTTAAAVLALGIGLLRPDMAAPGQASDPVLAAADAALSVQAQDESLLATNPDFFAWLGSDEIRTLAME